MTANPDKNRQPVMPKKICLNLFVGFMSFTTIPLTGLWIRQVYHPLGPFRQWVRHKVFLVPLHIPEAFQSHPAHRCVHEADVYCVSMPVQTITTKSRIMSYVLVRRGRVASANGTTSPAPALQKHRNPGGLPLVYPSPCPAVSIRQSPYSCHART